MIDCAVILAVGSPSHQSRLVQDRPRAMLPALGKPLIVRSLEPLYRAGIRHFVLVVGIDEGSVAAYLHRQWMPDVQIEFAIRPPQLTLAQALSEAARKLNRPFLLSAYNVFTPSEHIASLLQMAKAMPDEFILSISRETPSAATEQLYADLQANRIRGLARRNTAPASDESSWIACCMAACGAQFIDYLQSARQISQGAYFAEIVTPYLAEMGALASSASWSFTVESDADLLLLNRTLLSEGNDAHILCEIPHSVRIIAPVRIDPGVSIGQNAVIGPNAYLERSAIIGADAQIRNAVIIERAAVQPGAIVENTILSRRGPVVG